METVSKNELIINKKKQKINELAMPKYIISPNGKFRVRWDLLSVTLICCKVFGSHCISSTYALLTISCMCEFMLKTTLSAFP